MYYINSSTNTITLNQSYTTTTSSGCKFSPNGLHFYIMDINAVPVYFCAMYRTTGGATPTNTFIANKFGTDALSGISDAKWSLDGSKFFITTDNRPDYQPFLNEFDIDYSSNTYTDKGSNYQLLSGFFDLDLVGTTINVSGFALSPNLKFLAIISSSSTTKMIAISRNSNLNKLKRSIG
jgi:hypothetical protein